MKNPPTFLELICIQIIVATLLVISYLYDQRPDPEPEFFTLEQAAQLHQAALNRPHD